MTMDASTRISRLSHACRDIGQIIGGLAALKEMSDEIFIITPGRIMRAFSRDIMIDGRSILAAGLPVVPFEGTTTWDRDWDGPCVNFTLSDGKDGLLAPAERPKGMDVGKEIMQFFKNCYDDDDVFLSDISMSIRAQHGHEGDDIVMKTVRVGSDTFTDEDALVVLGHTIVLGSIVWAEGTSDGDGNRYLHLVLAEGRYLRISVGDLSR